ncbi:MAG: hypothetical protein IKW77_06155 [Salinivirgaceae bacterium]|nr:hypothetical protein [Salinivirgaceae bacterium]
MKKIIKFGLIATVLAAFAFAGCKNDDDEELKKEDDKTVVSDTTNITDTTPQVPDTIGMAELVQIKVGTPFSKGVIDKFLPADKSTSVDVFDKPQVVFNVPLNTDTAFDWKSVYRISIAEFTLKKADGTQINGTFSSSSDSLTSFFNMPEPYENGASYSAYVKIKFEQKVGNVWQIIKDENGNDYFEEQTTEFTAGERRFAFDPKHILYAYPADRQYAFLPKEYQTAYMILDFDYSYLLNQYKEKGYEQKIRITPFGGETTTVDFTYTTATNGFGSAEIDYSIADLRLDTNVIYHLAIVNIAKDSSQTDASVPYEIYAIDFRTSYYNTISEKMDNTSIGGLVKYKQYHMKSSWVIGIKTDTFFESFDDYDYNKKEPSRSLIHVNLDYDNCEWYKEKMAPLIYENADVQSIVGDCMPPAYVHYYIYGAQGVTLTDEEVKTGKLEGRSNWMTYNWYLDSFEKDFKEIRNILVKYSEKSPVRKGVEEFLKHGNIPSLTEGKYPMKLEYVLPGKKIVTTTLIVDMEYRE